mmetsp:Transcript_4371/g.9520  ORF Transcript_4371/g.9520 Transcript_4371/m.9520 type:complete len:195 (-) Transcript_4371:522-1106(-)
MSLLLLRPRNPCERKKRFDALRCNGTQFIPLRSIGNPLAQKSDRTGLLFDGFCLFSSVFLDSFVVAFAPARAVSLCRSRFASIASRRNPDHRVCCAKKQNKTKKSAHFRLPPFLFCPPTLSARIQALFHKAEPNESHRTGPRRTQTPCPLPDPAHATPKTLHHGAWTNSLISLFLFRERVSACEWCFRGRIHCG